MCPASRGYRILRAVIAVLLTIGNEIVSGDVVNTNAAWLAQRLEGLGVKVALAAAVPDEIETVAEFVNRERVRADHLIVTGGLGGTPDDLTREAIAAAFGVEQVEVLELADELRSRYSRSPDYAARWAQLPAGSRPLRNPKGGAPGFAIENVWVLPGLPVEMEAMFEAYADEFRGRAADRVVAPAARDARERHRPPARKRNDALARGVDRLVSPLRTDGAGGRGRAQVGRPEGARRGGCVARAGARRSVLAVSSLEPNRCEPQHLGERFVVAVEMEDCSLVLVGTSRDEQIRYRQAMWARHGELALSRAGDRDRLGVGTKLVERVEIVLQLFERARGASAVEHLESGDWRKDKVLRAWRRASAPGRGQTCRARATAELRRWSAPGLVGEQQLHVEERRKPLERRRARLRRSSARRCSESSPRALPPSSARRSSRTRRSVISGQRS